MKIFAALTAALAILFVAGCGPEEPQGRIEADTESATEGTDAPEEGASEEAGNEEDESSVEKID